MAHPLRSYARHVQRELGSRGYQWCLRFVQTHWDEVQGMPKKERLAKLAEEAKRIVKLADLALKKPAR